MDDDYVKKEAAAEKLHEKARHLRGRFLNHVAVIERDIAVILTEYFCAEDENKRSLFFEKVTRALQLTGKKEILIEIVKRDYPNYWNENGGLIKNLQTIQEFRNKLAHSVVDVSDEALARPIEAGVGFLEWKKGKPVTDEEFEDLEVKANMVKAKLDEIKRLLPFKEKPNP